MGNTTSGPAYHATLFRQGDRIEMKLEPGNSEMEAHIWRKIAEKNYIEETLIASVGPEVKKVFVVTGPYRIFSMFVKGREVVLDLKNVH